MAGFYDWYDVAVVGGGHAGIEAALASARMGLKTLLVTQTVESIARMSCNPSVGGIAKGNIVREIDALGGEMARLIDRSMIQFRMLNKSRGPAVQAPRSQADKILYAQLARQVIETTPGLHTLMDTVVDILTEESEVPLPSAHGSRHDGMRQRVTAIVTERGRVVPCRAVVLTTGTFLGGRIFIGDYDAPCGRLGELAAVGLTAALHRLGFTTGRLKTGTPPRVLRRTVDFSMLEEQAGDAEVVPFSFDDERVDRPMVSCHLVYTNEETHRIIRENIGQSPLYSGKISGVGPRYCPSIEDKVMRFADRSRHQLFVEPEGLSTDEIYLNGLSSSLPEAVQDAFVRTLAGFANATISRPAYAVEYDYVEPTQLLPSLETKRVAGLFNAGQINGTSGYEEAAGQGLVAGINAALYARAHRALCGPLCTADTAAVRTVAQMYATARNTDVALAGRLEQALAMAQGSGAHDRAIPQYEPLVLGRDEAYIGVLIDDLVTLGTKEPYRMFTARAEYRLKLRHDTADRRLAEKAHAVGLKSAAQLARVRAKYAAVAEACTLLEADAHAANPGFAAAVWELAREDVKYKYYIQKQDARIAKMHRMENKRIPPTFDYGKIPALSAESRQKLERVRPVTLGQASRISGIRNSDIMLLMVYVK